MNKITRVDMELFLDEEEQKVEQLDKLPECKLAYCGMVVGDADIPMPES